MAGKELPFLGHQLQLPDKSSKTASRIASATNEKRERNHYTWIHYTIHTYTIRTYIIRIYVDTSYVDTLNLPWRKVSRLSPERVSQCRLTIQYGEFPFDGMGYGEATMNRPVVRLSYQ